MAEPSQGPLFAAVDAGTTGARAAVVDLEGTRLAEVRRPYPTEMPRTGWAEQDAALWAERSVEALAGLPAELRRRVVAIGLTGQSPSVAPVAADGTPTGPGMIYRDNRAVAEAEELRDRLGAEHMHRLTGHTPEAFHVGPKVLWFRRHHPEAFARTRWFLQPRDLVLLRLSGRALTDRSHANCTLFYDLAAGCWAQEVFDAVDLDPSVFPEAIPSADVAAELPGAVAEEVGLRPGLPIVIGAGDSQCVAFGTGVVAKGPISEMSGSSSCINSAVPTPRRDRRITHFHHVVEGWYTTELGLNTTGAAVQWAVATLGFDDFDDLATAATVGRQRATGGGAGGGGAGGPAVGPLDAAPAFLPYLGDGERDDPEVRAAFLGLSDRHDRADLAYAVLEGVAAGVAGVVDILRRAGSPLEELRVSGGGARLPVLGQVKADLLGAPVVHFPADASAIGAALLAAQAAGHAEEAAAAIAGLVARADRFEPDPARADAVAERRAWIDRVRRAAAVHRGGRR